MRITSVELENIKSYGERTCIEFTEGLNAVCGLNGSGKTTVLEAIGWALFDFLPYPQQAFLREGERSGTVRVRLLAPDGREYEVVRRIGSGSAYYVSDVELNARLADRVDNVLDWVRTYAMDMDGETDLKALFRNAVGVPQGLMTSVFLESASVRKGIFDPLLRVEEYGRACEYLRDTVNYLRNLSGTVKEEIAGLMTDVERIPSAREEVEDLQDQLHQSDERLAGLVTELSDVEGRKAALDEVELRLRELQGELAASEYDVQRHADMLAVQEHTLASAIEAERVVREAEPGYRLVLAARERLAALEQHRLERDRLEREKTEVRTRMRGIHEQIERLDRELLAALGAAEKAAELAEAVARQSELEERVQQATPRAGDGDRLDRQIMTIRCEIDELERARAASQRAIEEARRALEDSGRLGDVQDRLQQTRDQLATMEPIRQQQESIQSEGSRLRKRYDALHAELQRKDELQKQLANLETVTVEAETLSRQLRELREERVRVNATIEYRSVARTDLERRHCPLLDLQCPAVTDDAGLLGRFDDRGRELPARAAALETELAALEERVVAAQAAQVEVQRLHVELAPLTRSEGELPEVQERLEECREQYRAFSDILSTKDELEGERRALEAELTALQQARERAGQLPLLEEQREGERRRLEARNEDLRAVEGQRAELAALEEQARSIAAELESLGDPRSRQQRLLVQAERRAELETSQRQHEQRLTEDSDRLKAVVGRLQQYTALDEEMEVQRSVERDHGALEFRECAKDLITAINTHLFNAKTGLYYLNMDIDGSIRTVVTGDLVFPVMFGVAPPGVAYRIISRLNNPDFQTEAGLRTVSRLSPDYTPYRDVGLLGGVWPGLSFWYAFAAAKTYPDTMAHNLKQSYAQYLRDPKIFNTVPGQFSEWFDGESLINRGMRLSPWEPPRFLWAAVEGVCGLMLSPGPPSVNPLVPPEWKWVALRCVPYRGAELSYFAARQDDGSLHRALPGPTIVTAASLPEVSGWERRWRSFWGRR